jgi:hypothetical protein
MQGLKIGDAVKINGAGEAQVWNICRDAPGGRILGIALKGRGGVRQVGANLIWYREGVEPAVVTVAAK